MILKVKYPSVLLVLPIFQLICHKKQFNLKGEVALMVIIPKQVLLIVSIWTNGEVPQKLKHLLKNFLSLDVKTRRLRGN